MQKNIHRLVNVSTRDLPLMAAYEKITNACLRAGRTEKVVSTP